MSSKNLTDIYEEKNIIKIEDIHNSMIAMSITLSKFSEMRSICHRYARLDNFAILKSRPFFTHDFLISYKALLVLANQ